MANIKMGEALLSMIKRAKELKKMDMAVDYATPAAYIKERCTISFSLPRKCGNSTALNYAASKLKNVKKIYPGRQSSLLLSGKPNNTIYDFCIDRNNNYEIVMLDMASYTSDIGISKIAKRCEQLYLPKLIIVLAG